MIKKGDRVKFISDTTVGVVTSINGSIASVMVEDGFEIPAMITDLVVVAAEAEQEAMKKMGVGDGTPVNAGRHKPDAPKEKIKTPRRSAPQYGRIALADDYEDEDPIDLSYIKSNYIRQTAQANETARRQEEERQQHLPAPTDLTDYEIRLCFVPDRPQAPETSARLTLHLVNDSSYSLLYSIAQWNDGTDHATALKAGQLDEDSKEEIAVIRMEELNRPRRLLVSAILFKPTRYVPQPTESFTLELSPLKFVRRGNYVETDYFEEPIVIYTVASSREQRKTEPVVTKDTAMTLAEALKEKGDRPKTESRIAPEKKPHKEPEIVDLHAEQILDDTAGMTPGEILKAQLSRFEIALDLAVNNNRGGRMVFIHGVGSGKLKYEMKKLLASKYPRLRYQDASFQEYGYGAIMVFL